MRSPPYAPISDLSSLNVLQVWQLGIMSVDEAQEQVAKATPWALHSFGYRAGLPTQEISTGSLVFETHRRVVGISMAHEPVGSPGITIVSPVGPDRVIVSVIADAPIVSKRHIVIGVDVEIDGLRGGAISLETSEEAAPDRCHSIILGDPKRFTYDKEERLAVRGAIWKIEDEHLSGELTRRTIPGLQVDLLLESPNVQRIEAKAAYAEIVRQLTGGSREEAWGYLWNTKTNPTPADGNRIMSSRAKTLSMNENIHAVTETILRACGVKPLATGFESDSEALDAVAFSLVYMRGGGSVERAAKEVMKAVARYGQSVRTDAEQQRPRKRRPRRP